MDRGVYGDFMGFLGVPLINGGSDRGFGGVYGVYGGLWGVLKGTKRRGANVHKIPNF